MNRFYKLTVLSILTNAFIIGSSALFTSCDKSATSDPPAPPPPPPLTETHGTRLVEMITDNGNTTTKRTFHYTADSLIEKIVDTAWTSGYPNTKNILSKNEFQRDNNKQVVKILFSGLGGDVDPVIDLLKMPNHYLVQHSTYKVPVATLIERWYGFDNDKRVIADTVFDITNNRIAQYYVFTYDANGNLVSQEAFVQYGPGNFTSTYLYTFTYDQKKNPFYYKDRFQTGMQMTLFNYPYSKNNILTIDYLNKLSGDKKNFRTHTYTYNKDDLPVTRTTWYESAGKDTTTFFYK